MSEKTFYRMLLLSAAFHIVFLTIVSLSVYKKGNRSNPFATSYSVNLVDDIGGKSKDAGQGPPLRAAQPNTPVKEPKKPELVPKEAKPPAQLKEPRESVRTLVPKKLPTKESTGTTKDELRRLDERIKEMKRRTANSEPSGDARRAPGTKGEGSPGLKGARGSGQSEQNPALVRYLVAMRDKIESAWHIPFMSGVKKNLEAKVTVKIRRDGRIIDISIDRRSGNRAYDESVLRVLRAVDPLPPIPQSVDEEPLEVEMTLRPEGIS